MADIDYLQQTQLGKHSAYPDTYTPSLLTKIERRRDREHLSIQSQSLPFTGCDIWNAYEISWLTESGMPKIAVAEFFVPANSPYMIESKSLKLYLGSFNQTTFTTIGVVGETIETDLSSAAGAPVRILLHESFNALKRSCKGHEKDEFARYGLGPDGFNAVDLDQYKISCTSYHPDDQLLKLAPKFDHKLKESLLSNLFRSNCPVTDQPDWASIQIKYDGPAIDHESLLRYLVSYRKHAGFHENCVEKIFMDIKNRCKPDKLSVYARYTRRGGLDINPFRSDFEATPDNVLIARQ